MSDHKKPWLAFAATWVAGFVDATGWILLSRIYASNMTGNSIEMSVRWLGGDRDAILQRGWPVLMFVCGLVLAATVTEMCVRRNFLSFSAINLALEAALIGSFVPLALPVFQQGEIHSPSAWYFNGLVALLALAMGIQNQTISRVGALNFRTTHVTGTLSRFGADLAEYLFWLHDRLQTPGRLTTTLKLSTRTRHFRGLRFNFGLFVFFVAGAITGVYMKQRWGVAGLVLPVIILAVLTAIDLVRPIAASAELEHIEKE